MDEKAGEQETKVELAEIGFRGRTETLVPEAEVEKPSVESIVEISVEPEERPAEEQVGLDSRGFL